MASTPLQSIGVYAIVNNGTGECYVGSAQVDLAERWEEHQRLLRRGAHTSPSLQEAYVRDGARAFSLRVLIYCEPYECVRYEQYFLDLWRHKRKLYNANPWASWLYSDRGGLGYLDPREARRQQEEIRSFNALLKAMMAEGIAPDQAQSIARNIYPLGDKDE